MTRQIDTGTDRLLAHIDDGGVLRIVLSNPDRFNSLTADMFVGIRRLLVGASDDDRVRAVLIRGAGDAAFASGADLGEQTERAETHTPNPDRGDFVPSLLSCTKPVVALIHGYCLGAGLIVAMTADLRIVADDAQFSIPATRLGVAYPLAAVQLLVEIVGRGAAARILLPGDRFDAAEALRLGLVTSVVPKAELESTVDGLLATLAASAPLSMAIAKASIANAATPLRHDVAELEARIDGAWASADAKEGMLAFFEKRPPAFEGR